MILPLVGQDELRARIGAAIAGGRLPASLLLQGPPGGGKERLALWIAQRLLCASPRADNEPCGACQACSYVLRGVHPDLLWCFPRPRLKDSDPDTGQVMNDLAEAIEKRVNAPGAWEAPDPTDAMYVATVRALVQRAGLTPALGARKVIIMADAHKLAPQESSEEASNAFLKLLEEPLADTTIVLTSSMPSALLPTIRSRVASLRVPPLTEGAARELSGLAKRGDKETSAAKNVAAALLDAAGQNAAARYRAAFGQGSAGARGSFSDALDELTALLHERARASASRGDARGANGAARGIAHVEDAKRHTRQNVNPQLITATLLEQLAPLLQ